MDFESAFQVALNLTGLAIQLILHDMRRLPHLLYWFTPLKLKTCKTLSK